MRAVLNAALLLLLGASAAAAGEFSLRYTLTPGGPPLGTHAQVMLVGDAPLDRVKQPSFHSPRPLFLTAQLGDGPNSLFTFAVDESTPGTGYNRLYVDTRHRRDLTGSPPVPLSQWDGKLGFKPVALLIEVGGRRVLYHAAIWRVDESRGADYFLSSWGYYSGQATFGTQTHSVVLVDSNGNGRFDDVPKGGDVEGSDADLLALDLPDDGRLSMDRALPGPPHPFCARRLQVDGRFYDVAVRADGSAIRVAPISIPTATLRSPSSRFALLLWSKDGMLALHGERGTAQIPAGDYRLLQCWAERYDREGNLWEVRTHRVPDVAVAPSLSIHSDRTLATPGSPLLAKLSAAPVGRRQYDLQLSLTDSSGTPIDQIIRNGQLLTGVRIRIVDARGRTVASLPFPHGWEMEDALTWSAPPGVHGELRAVPGLPASAFAVTSRPAAFVVP